MAAGEPGKIAGKNKGVKYGSIRSIFMHADRVDLCLMILGFFGAVIDGLTDRFRLFFAGHMINSIGSVSTSGIDALRHNLNKNAVGFLYLACIAFVACFLEGYCWTRTGERQTSRMRAKYLKAVLRQDISYFDLDSNATSEVTTTIANDIFTIQDAISEKVPEFVRKISTLIGGYMVAFIVVWQLAMIALPTAFLLFIPSWLCGRSLVELSGKIRSQYKEAGTTAQQAVSSIRTVYAFVGEEKTGAQFSAALNKSVKLGVRQGLVKGLSVGTTAIVYATWALMLYYGGKLVMSNQVQGGTIYAAGLSIVIAGQALGNAQSIMKDLAEACCAGKHVMEVIKRTPKIDVQNSEGMILENVSGEIKFDQVKFSYPSRPESVVLENFSLTIPAKKTVALIGPSGSGKSTALALLQRFYDPLAGEILLDGVAIDKLQLKWLRSQMAWVSQEPILFSTSIKENLLFGKEDAEMDHILEVSKACDAHNFISQLPQAYNTEVGERGFKLSGGQKQRIAIARAIIKKPRILLLDEATSALDSESERVVQEAVDKVAIGRTTIIIAHRLSTIKNADIIVVMEDGKVKETGSHSELIKREDGLYCSLVRLQQMDKDQKNNDQHSFPLSSSSSKELVFNNTKIIESNSVNPEGTNNTSSLEDPIKTPKVTIWRILRFNKLEWKQAVLGYFSAVLSGSIKPLYSIAMGITIWAYFLSNRDEMEKRIRVSSCFFVGLSVFSLVISISQHYSFAFTAEYLTKRIREEMLSKILTFEVGWFDKDGNSSSVICSTLSKDANLVRSLMGDKLSLLIQAISAVTIAWTISLVIAWRLAIVIILVQPFLIACIYSKRFLLKSMHAKAIQAQQESTKLATEAVVNFRSVAAFCSQDRILKLLEKTQQGQRKKRIRYSFFAGISLGVTLSVKVLYLCLNFWYGGKLISEGYLNPRAIFQTIILLASAIRTISDAGALITILFKGWEAIRSIFAILDRDTRIEPEDLEGHKPEKITGHIELFDVHFAYPTRPNVMIFQGLSIKVKAGKSMGLVGKSGSGKSTIVSLIERFYDPSRGVVKIDGQDIKSYHLRSLRKFIALVSQEPTLFSGTIRENIVYGQENVTESEIREAAKLANIHEFISMQKDDYNALCGDKGLQLSGGQKQRIAVARAILRSPSVLLLDEATSALDSQAEKAVQKALERVMVGRTSIVVAHRLSTIQNCDEIVVLDRGQVVEKGTHSSLMEKGPNGAYNSLVNLQTMEL